MNVDYAKVAAQRKKAAEPEVHVLGQVRGLSGFDGDNAFAAFEVRHGEAWECVGGDLSGQTQVDYPIDADAIWNHPLDLHFFTTTLQGWPHLVFDVYRLDSLGERELIGYSFCFLPSHPGHHKVECPVWRPQGSTREEAYAFFLGGPPELVSRDLIFDKARDDRCRLFTISGGRIHLEIDIMMRNARPVGVDVEHRTGAVPAKEAVRFE